MATELGDPHFCPPRQVRQGQGRGSVYEILSMQGALRISKTSRATRNTGTKINAQAYNDAQSQSNGGGNNNPIAGNYSEKPAVLREASFSTAGDSASSRNQHGVRRIPSFPVYYHEGRMDSRYSERATTEEDTSEYDNLTDQSGSDASKSTIIQRTLGAAAGNLAKRPPSGREVRENSPTWRTNNQQETKKDESLEKRRSRGALMESKMEGKETTQRSGSWVWNQDELIHSARAAVAAGTRISDKKPSQDSGISLMHSPENEKFDGEIKLSSGSGSAQSAEVAAKRIFHARVVSCDREEDTGRRGDTSSNHGSLVKPEGEDDSAWFGSGVNGEHSILKGGFVGVSLGSAVADCNEFEELPQTVSPSVRHRQQSSLISESTNSSGDRSSIGTDMSGPHYSTVTETSVEYQEPCIREAEDVLGKLSASTTVQPTHPDYDSETLRRAAAKNREVSRKLFSRLREQQQQRGSPRNSPRHERQYSGVSGSSEGTESPMTKRSLTKSPSQLSSNGASSVYAESSSGSSSGIGTLSQSVSHCNSLTKEYACSPVIQRSTSSETLSGRNTNIPGICAVPQNSLGNQWNTPQSRRNIMSMVEPVDAEYLSAAIAQDPSGRSEPAHATEFVGQTHRTSSSAAASRGVSRKISSRKKAAREETFECMRSMPDLTQQSELQIEDTPTTSNLRKDYKEHSGGTPRFLVPESTPSTTIYLNGSVSTEFSVTKQHRDLCRSASPIYAVPNKEQSNLAEHSASNSRVSVSTTKLDMMKSPPPLPRKPPPPLSDLPEILPSPTSNKYSSSPCLLNQDQVDMNQRNNNNGYHGNLNLPNGAIWPPSRAQPWFFAPPPPQIVAPVQNANYSAMTSGGKPTVQVHPMCQGSLTVSVESPKKLHQDQPQTMNSMAASPRPPVPKKPNFLSPERKGTPPKVPAKKGVPITNGILTSSMIGTGVSLVDSPRKQEQLNYLDEKCTRLSQFVCENDESLAGILKPNQILTVDCLGDQMSGVQLNDGHHPEPSSSHSSSAPLSPNSTSAWKAKFLVNIYSSSASPSLSNLNRESVDGCDTFELERKKLELIASLSRKLKILDEEQKAIKEELNMNEKLGGSIEEWLNNAQASDHQRDKFRLHVDDTNKITCLLLRLSGQIARVENALNKLPGDAAQSEKALLLQRRDRLLSQKEDAKGLQTSLEKRGNQVMGFLRELLVEEQVGDYQYFIQMKKKLLVDAKEIEDKIKLGTEQKEALENSLHNSPGALATNGFVSQSTTSLIG